jgi:hypothetical protein
MADGPSTVSEAADRLEKALGALEARVRVLKSKASHGEGDLFDRVDSGESADLDAALARRGELESAARDASAALGRAAQEMRAILNGEG